MGVTFVCCIFCPPSLFLSFLSWLLESFSVISVVFRLTHLMMFSEAEYLARLPLFGFAHYWRNHADTVAAVLFSVSISKPVQTKLDFSSV